MMRLKDISLTYGPSLPKYYNLLKIGFMDLKVPEVSGVEILVTKN